MYKSMVTKNDVIQKIKDQFSDEYVEFLKTCERKDNPVAAYTDWKFQKLAEMEFRLRKLEDKSFSSNIKYK